MTGSIGMIGVGLMGLGIATNLVRKGHRLTVMDHPGNQPLDDLRAQGVAVVDTPAAVAQASEVVLLCVTGAAQVESVIGGPQGCLGTLRPTSLVIDCSTSLPETTERMAALVAQTDANMIDAAMTRTPAEAMQGRLNLLVGGHTELFERALPILRCFAENITHTGPVGSGHRMKLLHNFVSLGMVTLIAEAAACANAAGLDAAVFTDVLSRGGGGGTALERIKPYLLHQDPNGLKFSLANALKDITYYSDMAQATGAVHAVAQGVQSNLKLGCERGDPQVLVSELVGLLARTAPPHA
jgi:3-hydroxyisobutyrate dehydrogenase-like beta-hydroxyacid dehydrogenase